MSQYTPTTQYDYDLFVIGAGSGGVRAARMAAGLGAKVAIAEERYFGGTCVNVGCVPKKLYVYASQFSESFAASAGFGWQVGESAFNWAKLVANKDKEIARLESVYQKLLNDSQVDIKNGRAIMLDAHRIQVGEEIYSAERIIIATGGWPFVPDVKGREHIITSNEIFNLTTLPKKMVIVGGGYIAIEFACIMHGLGVSVTIVERNSKVLRGFDDDVRDFLMAEMQKKGITFIFNSYVESIEKQETGYQVCIQDTIEDDLEMLAGEIDSGLTLNTDIVMYATGRMPNSKNLGLEALGVTLDLVGAIKVNEDYQTSVPNIYALGDVTNRVNLTPVATSEGMSLVHKLYSSHYKKVDYDNIPTAVFSQPSIGSVGLTEAQALNQHPADIDVFKADFKAMKNSISGSNERTLMKMLVVRSTDQVVGMHMVGPDAGEIIQGFAVALRAGATKAIFDSTIGIHPTAAEEFVTMRKPAISHTL